MREPKLPSTVFPPLRLGHITFDSPFVQAALSNARPEQDLLPPELKTIA